MKFITSILYSLVVIVSSIPYRVFSADIVGDTGDKSSVSITNPLKSKTLLEFLNSILDVIMVFAVPIIVFFIIYAGFKFVMARGNETEITTAKNALLFAVIGGVIILGAKVILSVISGTISQF